MIIISSADVLIPDGVMPPIGTVLAGKQMCDVSEIIFPVDDSIHKYIKYYSKCPIFHELRRTASLNVLLAWMGSSSSYVWLPNIYP